MKRFTFSGGLTDRHESRRGATAGGGGAENAAGERTSVPLPTRWAFWFGLDGDLRFLSHHDMMRLMERAVARAGLPVKHSQGFNPRPKLSLVLPRPVGVASRRELLTLDFEPPLEDPGWACRLAGQLPAGMTALGAQPLASGKAPRVRKARYEITLRPEELPLATAHLAELGRPAAPVEDQPGRTDLRARLGEVKLENDTLTFELLRDETGPGRPKDALKRLGLVKETQDAQPEAAREGERGTQTRGMAFGDPVLARLVRTDLECDFQ